MKSSLRSVVKTAAFVAAAVVLLVPAIAAAFSVDVGGPDKAEPDTLVILEAKGEGVAFKWIPQSGTAKYLRFESRRKLAFVPPENGEYEIMLIAAGVDDSGGVAIATHVHTVSVSGEVPPLPDPDPIPNPEPTPSVYGLDKFARKNLSLVDESAREKAVDVASSFEAACGRAVGTDSTVAKLNADIATNNARILGDDRESWEPWLKALQMELARLARSGRLVNLEQHVAAYREVASGLKK